MIEWTKQKGPTCSCGFPTMVTEGPDGDWGILCLWHATEEGAWFPLPSKRPEDLPEDPEEWDIQKLIDQALKEQNSEDGPSSKL